MTWRPTLDAYEPSLVVAADQAAKFVAEMHAQAAAITWPQTGSVADSIPRTGRWLTFAGSYGSGKTMLARQILGAAPRSFPNCRYGNLATASCVLAERRFIECSDFAQALKRGEYDLPEQLSEPWLLVFDDIGTARDPSGFVAEGLFRLANQRLGKWTVWTSNLGRDEIAHSVDARVASRLIRDRNAFVPISAGDYALRHR